MNKQDKFNRNSKLIRAFSNLDNWKPNFTLIHKETGVATSTLYDFYKRLSKQHRIKLYVEILSESDVKIRDLENQLEAEQIKQLTEEQEGDKLAS